MPDCEEHDSTDPAAQCLSAVTLAVRDMRRSVAFYRALRFRLLYGGPDEQFTSFAVGSGYLNLVVAPACEPAWWGRVIFYVGDVDAFYATAIAEGLTPSTVPRDASWGERFFHISDPDGHELSFARPLNGKS